MAPPWLLGREPEPGAVVAAPLPRARPLPAPILCYMRWCGCAVEEGEPEFIADGAAAKEGGDGRGNAAALLFNHHVNFIAIFHAELRRCLISVDSSVI